MHPDVSTCIPIQYLCIQMYLKCFLMHLMNPNASKSIVMHLMHPGSSKCILMHSNRIPMHPNNSGFQSRIFLQEFLNDFLKGFLNVSRCNQVHLMDFLLGFSLMHPDAPRCIPNASQGVFLKEFSLWISLWKFT